MTMKQNGDTLIFSCSDLFASIMDQFNLEMHGCRLDYGAKIPMLSSSAGPSLRSPEAMIQLHSVTAVLLRVLQNSFIKRREEQDELT